MKIKTIGDLKEILNQYKKEYLDECSVEGSSEKRLIIEYTNDGKDCFNGRIGF